MSETELTALLDERLPGLGPQQRTHILEATAIAAYHAQMECPVIKLLVCDDAGQFKWVTEDLGLCWIHEGRHYKKLDPSSAPFRAALDQFSQQFWEYYDQLLSYRQQPSPAEQETAGGRVRHPVRHRHGLPGIGRAHRQDQAEESQSPDGAQTSRNPTAQ